MAVEIYIKLSTKYGTMSKLQNNATNDLYIKPLKI